MNRMLCLFTVSLVKNDSSISDSIPWINSRQNMYYRGFLYNEFHYHYGTFFGIGSMLCYKNLLKSINNEKMNET